MREILFRGKTVYGRWVDGSLMEAIKPLTKIKTYAISRQDVGMSGLLDIAPTYYHVKPNSIGQYTGLIDKNGKRIFEGDIVTFKTTNYSFRPCVVEYRNETAQFVVTKNDRSYPMADDFIYEVIGNIHDNPELIGGVSDENA